MHNKILGQSVTWLTTICYLSSGPAKVTTGKVLITGGDNPFPLRGLLLLERGEELSGKFSCS
jgi:hypothetical protein